MVSLLPAIVSGALVFSAPPDRPPSVPARNYTLLVSPERRVRAADTRVQDLLATGLQRSATFARLLAALNDSDVIVYIERLMTLPGDTMGRLTIVPVANGQRYLRIQIRSDLPSTEAVALIGHEMRHALEVAEVPAVRDAESMIKLYRRIGHSSGGDHVYDTTAAQDTGRQVRRELLGT